MSHIFISYSHKDKDYAQKLQETLIQEGFEVWIDDRIEYGDEWPMVIQDRLDACDVFILIASENSYRSKWVQKEVTRAQRTEKPFFPLLLNGHPWLTIESTQYVDVRNQSLPTERFYQKLARYTLRKKTESPSQPTNEETLKTLKSQAIQYELIGDFGHALNVWYEIKRLGPHDPRVDRKIAELEKELLHSKQEVKKEAKPTPEKPERAENATLLEALFQKLAAIQLNAPKLFPILKITGFIILAVLLLWGGARLVSSLTPSLQGSGAYYPFVFSVETGDEVNVYSYDINSNRLSLVDLGPGKNWDPTYSGLGTIYFTSNRDGKAEIYRLVNGIPERVTFAPGQFQSWDPVLSPNGTLYFTCNQFDGKAEICRLVDTQTVRVTQTPGEFQSWGPVINKTGTIYYTTDRERKREVYKLVNTEPQSVTVTPDNYESWGPAISPLTGALYFTSNRVDGKAEIYRLVDDAEADPVTTTQADFESWGPVIAADGTIYYTSTKEDGIRQVFMLVDRVSRPLPDIPGRAEGFTDFLTGILPAY